MPLMPSSSEPAAPGRARDGEVSFGVARQGPSREAAMLTVLIGIYVVVVAVLAATGRYMFIFKTSIIPVLILVALLMGRLTVFVNDWSVFLASVILFDCFRGLVYSLTLHFHLPIHAAYVVRWDEALLGGESLPVLLQRKLFQPPTIGPFEKFLTIIHGSHFLLFLLVGMATWLLRRREFWRFRRAISLLMILGMSIYFLVPTVPPWMAAKLHIIQPIRHITAEIYNVAIPSLQVALDTNPIAAMPSLHTAFPTLCSLIALHHFGRRAIILPVYTCLMYFSISYLGEHYIVDIFAGILLAAFVYWVVYRSEWMREPQALGDPSPSGAPEEVPRAAWIRQAIIALMLVGLSEGLGQITLHTRHTLILDPTFVANDMVGRSDKVHLTLGRYALSRGDYATAERELRLAIGELRDPADRKRAEALLANPRGAVLESDDSI
jgi:hypothetical protein